MKDVEELKSFINLSARKKISLREFKLQFERVYSSSEQEGWSKDEKMLFDDVSTDCAFYMDYEHPWEKEHSALLDDKEFYKRIVEAQKKLKK